MELVHRGYVSTKGQNDKLIYEQLMNKNKMTDRWKKQQQLVL